MRTVYINSFGSGLDLSVHDRPDPEITDEDQVIVRVRAAGLNRADLLQASGHYPPPVGYSANIPGLEFAGEIEAIGGSVTDWKIGDRVFGITAGESQAERLVTDASLLAAIPQNLSFVEAAAVPEAFITAHDALITQAALKAGENLLIHAIGSGVGLAGLQLAKANGCRVIGTSRTADKLEKCRDLGLDAGLVSIDPPDFKDEILKLTNGQGANVILDLVGAAYFEQNLSSLALKGRLVLVGLTSGAKAEFNLALALHKRARIIGTVLRARTTAEKAEATANFVRDVVPFLSSGEVKPNVDHVFPVSDVMPAYEYLRSNSSFGKVVLEF